MKYKTYNGEVRSSEKDSETLQLGAFATSGVRPFFLAIHLVTRQEKKDLPFDPFRLLVAQKKLRELRTPCGNKCCRKTIDGDEADVEFIGAAWFTCFSEIE